MQQTNQKLKEVTQNAFQQFFSLAKMFIWILTKQQQMTH